MFDKVLTLHSYAAINSSIYNIRERASIFYDVFHFLSQHKPSDSARKSKFMCSWDQHSRNYEQHNDGRDYIMNPAEEENVLLLRREERRRETVFSDNTVKTNGDVMN